MSGDVVLVVDDVPQSLGALCMELEADGYTVLVASDGASALARLDLVTPDAILLDALMPGLDGFETCRRIKAHVEWSHIPVIFMTGLSETSHIVKGFDAGGVDYVVKPVRTQEVLARLATHVRNARAVRMAREAIDVGGHGVLVVDAHRRIAWRSPKAQRWVGEFFAAGSDTGVPRDGGHRPGSPQPDDACVAWLEPVNDIAAGSIAASKKAATDASANPSSAAPRGDSTADLRTRALAGRTLTARRLGSVGLGEVMWLLSLRADDAQPPSRLATASLTPRETEVLSWIAKGKTNRDVADILGMSPRTVNKHLEHVFEKLGVETRAAAAALASRELG